MGYGVFEELEKLKKKQEAVQSRYGNTTKRTVTPVPEDTDYGVFNELRKIQQKQDEFRKAFEIRPTRGGSGGSIFEDDDIAPVRKDKEEKESTWFQKGAFEDGFSLKNLGKAILGSAEDVVENVGTGIAGMGEKLIDSFVHLAPYYSQSQFYQNGGSFLSEDMQEKQNQAFEQGKKTASEFIQKDLYDEEKLVKQIYSNNTISKRILNADPDDLSVFGEKSDALAQSAGQLAATAGLQAVGVPWYLTTGITSYGGEVESALKQGATMEEAGVSGLITAGAEILTEKISGGIKFGGKTLDDALVKEIARGVSNKTVRTLTKLGFDAAGEGFEEVLSGAIGAVGQKLTYADDKELNELFSREDAWDSFIGGAVLGGGMSTVNAIKSNKKGVDYVTELTANEQKVVDKEYKDRVAEAEKDGKVSQSEKSKIYDRVLQDMEKGYISTDSIEETLGGDTYNNYRSTTASENNILKEFEELGKKQNPTLSESHRYNELVEQVKEIKGKKAGEQLKSKLSEEVKNLVAGDRLAESYNERTRRTQAFQADLSQYDEKQQAVVKKAVESGILNNTNRAHDFVDMVAKLSAKTGVLFDFTNNAKLKESGFAMDGKTINGYATKDGIAVNIQSAKALNTVVGHEITHVLKGTELYSELQNAALEFAQSKGEYQSRYDSLLKMYENVEDADIYEELTADLVGDYLFTDEAFISNLSTEHRNVFQKVYDEIKYMLKVATAGSKEARELEKVKRAFDKAFREMGTKNTADSGAKYSLNEFAQDGRRYVEIDQEQSRFDGHSVEDYPRIAKDIINEKFNGKVIGIDNKMFVNGAGRDEFANPSKRIPDEYYEAKMRTAGELDNLLDAGANFRNAPDGADGHVHKDVTGGFDYFDTLFKIGDRYYEAVINIKNVKRGKLFKDVTKIKDVTQDIMNSYGENPKFQFLRTSSMDIVSTEGEKVNPKFSISDTTGRQLSKEQAEYFKDSKVRDESGNLKVMYHGTPNGDFTVFKDGTYFTDNKEYADRYQNPGASSISTGKTASNPKTFAVYLDIKKPFDLNDAEAKRIYIEDYIKGGNAMGINPYLSDAEYAKINTIDWTEGEDLRDFLTENGYDYDGLVLDEGADGGYGDEVQSRGTSYVVFSPEQVKNIENAQPTADPDIRFSLSEATDETTVKSYAEITEEQQSLYQREMRLRERKQEAVSNPELLQAMDDYAGLFTEMRSLLPKRRDGTATQAELDRIEEIKALREEKLQRVADLQESLGLNAIAKEEAEIRETKEALRVAADAAWAREGAEKENKAIEKAGVPAEEYFRKKALKAFKTTTNFNEAGYMLPDGKLLNFSGGERNHRYRDHREIGEIYEATQGAAALNRFMRDGNIRIMAESPGIDLTSVVEPTKEQYAALRKFINTNGVAEGQFFVDFSGAEGENVGKYAYNGKIMADRILNDIKYFFQTGKVRESSGLLDFLSLSAEGETNKSFGNYNVYGRDIELDAPVKETQLAAENSTPNSTDEDSSVAPVAISQTETTTEDLFPDDTAPIQEEYEFLLAEREDIKGAMDAYAAVGNYDGAEQLMAEYEAVQARIAEIEADDTDRLASLDEADVPPEVDNAPEDVADNVPLTKVLVTNLAKQVKTQLGLGSNRTAEVRELIERYSNEEFPSKAHLYTEIQDRFGTYTEATVDEDLKGIKSLLRTYGINVSDSIKAEIADYGQLMRSNFDKVRFAKNGLPVDVAYKEFHEALPGLFPESIYVPTDQLMRIIEVANMDTTLETEYEIDWQTLEDVTDTIMNGVAEFKQNRKETLANKHGRESFQSLMEDADQYVPPIPENVAPARFSIAENIAPVRPAIESVQADPDDIAPVFETSSGQQSLMPEEETPKKLTRSELHLNIMDNIKTEFRERGFEFDEVLKKAKDLPTFATVDNTPQRVMEKALGYKEGQTLSDLTVNQVAQNETDGIRWLNSFTDKKTGLLAKISKQYGIKPGSKASAAAQMYAEGFYVGENEAIIEYGDKELAADFPDAKVQANIKKLARDPRIRQIYDETLAAINASRVRNAYPEIPRLDNYFLHFRAMEDTFSRLGLPFNPNDIRAKDLPTDLNGVTADLKPGQPYFASAKHRLGKRTSFDLLGGLEKYLTSAKNQIYHIDDIQTLRALRNYVAETYGQATGLQDLDLLSDEEAEQRIHDVYNSHLSTFAKFLNEEANVLAGKTSLIDRGLEGVIGRRGITFLDTLNKQVGANMVGFNVSSSLTNFLAPVQAFAKSNKADFVKAMAQTAYNKIGSIFGNGDNFTEESPVMIRRKGAERFYRTPYQKVADAGYVFMGVVDDLSTELIARTKYNELTRKGMSSSQAHYETDKWVSRLMGDRSLGQQPQLYNSKMLGLFTKFQLEVRNQLDSQFYDTIQEAKVSTEEIENKLLRNAKKAAKITSTFAQLAVMQHLFGKAFESVAGYNPAFDIIEALIKAFGWDDEEEDEDTVLDNIEEGFLSLLGDLPYTSTLTGGRIPIASALPVTEFIKGEDQYGNEKNRWQTLGEAAPYYLLPGGYGQIKKTKAGMEMFDEDLPIAGSYTNSGGLRFPVEDTTGNRVQAALFGQWASENARDYFDNERKPLKDKQIQEFIDSGMPIRDYWAYREGLAEHEKLADKADYIDSLDLPISTKNMLVNNAAGRKEPIDMADYGKYGSLEEMDFATKNPEKYDVAMKVGGYAAYMGYQAGMKDMKLAEKADYISRLNLTTAQKNILINSETDRKEPIDLTGYENFSNFEEFEYAKKNPEAYAMAKTVGGYKAYAEYSDALGDIKADKDKYGKSISGSRKTKVTEYIYGLDIPDIEKHILFKSQYPSTDDFNYEIIGYLNGRSDMTFEEKIEALRKLDFDVDAEGNIYW